MKNKSYYVYILTNHANTVLYTGVTSDLAARIYQHKHKLVDGFSAKYNLNKLVFYEIYEDPENAIKREKQIKAESRQKKLDLISSINPVFSDLYDQIL